MKILMITPYLPYPLFSGGQVRSYNIIKNLAKKHEVTLYALIRKDEEQKYLPELQKYCKKVVVFKRKKAFSLENIFLAGFTSWPFILHVYNNSEMKETVAQELEKEKYDLIHVETFYMMHNLPDTQVPLVLFEQNIEHDIYRRISKYFDPSFLRPLLNIDAAKIKKWEEYFWKKANALVVMSNTDKKFVNRDAFVCGNGVDIEKYQVSKGEKRILFIGNFKWFENRDAAEWIVRDIWPLMTKNDIKLWIVGRKIPNSIKQLTTDQDIFFDENAPEETSEIYKRASILLAPLRAGGGTSFKVLEAMASGLPVVTTSRVAEAIGARDKEEILAGDTAEELVKKAEDLLEDAKLYEKISKNARKLIEEKYDWKILVDQIEKIYESVL